MNSTFKQWLIGAANAALSGLASGGIGLGLGIGWKKSAVLLAGSAAVSLFKWIPQHPIPGGE